MEPSVSNFVVTLQTINICISFPNELFTSSSRTHHSGHGVSDRIVSKYNLYIICFATILSNISFQKVGLVEKDFPHWRATVLRRCDNAHGESPRVESRLIVVHFVSQSVFTLRGRLVCLVAYTPVRFLCTFQEQSPSNLAFRMKHIYFTGKILSDFQQLL